MFVNAAQDHEEAEEAVMISPVLLEPNICLQFYFQIKPYEGISSLIVAIENVNGKGEQTVIWQLSNIKLDFWEIGRVHIQNPDQYTLLIKAVRTGKQEGYAAIDDITFVPNEDCKLLPEDAQPPPPVTTTPSPILSCDFQNDNCGWILEESPFTFNRTTSKLLSEAGVEGPIVDHLDNKERKDIFTENFI